MNKKSKGRHHEKVIAELFRQAGWTVHLVQPAIAYNPKTGRYYARPQDIFGADIIAMKKWHMPVFIQVTVDSGIGRKVQNFQKYPFPWPIIGVYIFQAKKLSGKWKYRVIRIISETELQELSREDFVDYFGVEFESLKQHFR